MGTKSISDEARLARARRLGNAKSNKQAITSALRENTQRRQQLQILDLEGQVPFDENYDYKPLRRRIRPARTLRDRPCRGT